MGYTPPPEDKRCKGHKTNGDPCPNWAVKGKNVCQVHGGLTPNGAASPHFKHGQRSKHMPIQLATRYTESMSDPQLGDLMSNIALREAFIRERLETLKVGGDLVTILESLNDNYQALHEAYYAADSPGMATALDHYRLIIEDGSRYAAMRNEIEDALDSQRSDVVARAGIEHKDANAVTLDHLMTFMGAVIALLIRTMSNKQELNEALNGIDSLLRQPDRITESVGSGAPADTNGKR